MKHALFVFSLFVASLPVLSQPNCSAPSTGFVPINDLGTGSFNGWTGGLYPNGSNTIPAMHLQAGLQRSAQVLPRDTAGNVDPANGKIVWLSIGMSNTTQETQKFIPVANAYGNKNPKLMLVDGAQGGMTAEDISTPSLASYTTFWNTVSNRLTNAGVRAKQVQVIWLKEANRAMSAPILTYYDSLVMQLKRITNELKTRFPNAQLCYMSSRISARYASSALNPEPYAYYSGWAVKKAIEDQINGDPQLQYAGAGTKAPWLSWSTYLWSDGSAPQSTDTSVYWSCPNDFQNDGTHPSVAGANKVASLLLKFFQSEATACSWFFNVPPPFCAQLNIHDVFAPVTINNYPNPFSTSTLVRIERKAVAAKQPLSFYLYNSLGIMVRKIADLRSGEFTLYRDDLPAGIYFYKVTESSSNTQLGKGKLLIR